MMSNDNGSRHEVNTRPNINVVELASAVKTVGDTLSCASCHQVEVKDLKIHLSCGGAGRYCRRCSRDLSHCLICDEPLASPMRSFDEILAAVNGEASHHPSPGNLLSLLQGMLVKHQQKVTCITRTEPQHGLIQRNSAQIGVEALDLKESIYFSTGKKKRVLRDVGNLMTLGAASTDLIDRTPKKAKNTPAAPGSPTPLTRQQTRKLPHSSQQCEYDNRRIDGTVSTMFPASFLCENQMQAVTDTMPSTMPSTYDLTRRLENFASTATSQASEMEKLRSGMEFASPKAAAIVDELRPATELTQCFSSSLGTLPDTMDMARQLSQTKVPKLPPIENLSEETTLQTSTLFEFRRKCSPAANIQSNSCPSQPVESLPSTFDFARQLSTTRYGDSSYDQAPVVVAIETVTREQAEQCRQAQGRIHFIPRICRSTMDMEDCVILPSHFMTASSSDEKTRTCDRTFEYLKAIALGLCVVGVSWIDDQDDAKHGIWGDSQLAQRAAEVMDGSDMSPYSWLTSADWWGTSQGPCWSASRRARNGGQLLDGFLVRILPSITVQSQQALLEAEQAELLCLLAGAVSILSLDEDRSCFDHGADDEKRILLVPDHASRDSIAQLLESSHITLPLGSTLESLAQWRGKRETIIMKESWLIDSISAQVVAPVTLYEIGILRW